MNLLEQLKATCEEAGGKGQVRKSKEYQRGWDERQAGTGQHKNPHKPGSQEHRDWDHGWTDHAEGDY